MKWFLLFLSILLFAVPSYALTGKVLVVVCDKAVNKNTSAHTGNKVFSRCHAVQGWDYETCISSDTVFLKTIYPAGSVGNVANGSRYGRYDMMVWLEAPNPYYLQSDANCVTQGMPHFGQMIDRGSAWATPIPMFIPWGGQDFEYYGTNFAAAYTGIASSATLTSGKGEPYKDEQGDSLYMFTASGKFETLVIHPDSTANGTTYPFSFVHPLVWRHTAGRAEVKTRYATMWMTVGTGNHRVIYLPQADSDAATGNWLIAFSMFTKCQPIEIPVIAYAFGKSALTSGEAGTDTVEYGAGFKRNVDYAVANGIKLDLVCYPYYMQTENVTANKTQAIAYQAAYPNNIRLTLSSMYAWATTGVFETTGSYSQKVARLKKIQDSTGVYFPTINTTRMEMYVGRFLDPSLGRADSAVMALASRGITDVYTFGQADYGIPYPASSVCGVVGSQRTWINGSELKTHPIGQISRYLIAEGGTLGNAADWFKTAYVDTVGTTSTSSSVRRAQTIAKYLNYSIGNYRYIDGAINSNRGATASLANMANSSATFQAGMYLPALTFMGGSKTTWAGSTKTTRRAQVDSTRSVFLDTMKQLNAMKKMGDYIVATYGTTGQNPFIWAWMDEVKWDRKNGRQFPNSHVSK